MRKGVPLRETTDCMKRCRRTARFCVAEHCLRRQTSAAGAACADTTRTVQAEIGPRLSVLDSRRAKLATPGTCFGTLDINVRFTTVIKFAHY